MPFIPPLIAGVGSIIGGAATFLSGGTILAGIAKVGLGLAAQYAVGKIFGGPKQQAQAVQLETRYGDDIPREVILGRVGTAGHQVQRNSSGKGGRIVHDAFVLSHFRISGVRRYRQKGEWVQAAAPAGDGYGVINGTEGRAFVRQYLGTMGQAADPQLVSTSNPPDRWTAAHRLAGCAYIAVRNNLDREKLSNPWDCFVEVDGAPLYDWRKDSTAGGSGPHRWSDQSTWEFTENPVLMMYALERGIYNGTELMVGKGARPARLPLAEWTIAANICDEMASDGKARYRAALIASSGAGVTHEQNMQPLLNACAASWVEDASGEYPIVGANQAIVATITDDDLMIDESARFSTKRTRSELINTAAGSFLNPQTFYQSAPLATRTDAIALAADRERLATSIPYSAVTDPAVGDRLLDIAIRASRYQANGEICVHPRFKALKPGRWVRWNSARRGNRVYLVVSKRLGAMDSATSARNVYLTLQEVGAGVFDPTAYQTLPPDAVMPGDPIYQSELDNYNVAPFVMVTNADYKRAGIRSTWATIEDATITSIEFQYRPVNQPDALLSETASADQTSQQFVDGVVSNSDYELRYRLRATPARTIPWTAWVPVKTLEALMTDIYLPGVIEEIEEHIGESLKFIGDDARDLRDRMRKIAAMGLEQDGANTLDKLELRRAITASAQGIDAKYEEVVTVLVTDMGAVSQRVELVEVSLNDKVASSAFNALSATVSGMGQTLQATADSLLLLDAAIGSFSASGRFRVGVVATEAGAQSTIALATSASNGGTTTEAALFISALAGGLSQVGIVADRFYIKTGGSKAFPFVIEGGVPRFALAHIGDITAGVVRAPDNRFIFTIANGMMEWFD